MKMLMTLLLQLSLFAGGVYAKEPLTALGSISALAGAPGEVRLPVPVFRTLPDFEETQKLFPRRSNPLMEACRGEKSCFMALDGAERGLCEAYKEDKSCFMALEGVDQGWCEVLKEGRSCFMALDGEERERCEEGYYPWRHRFWARCGGVSLPDGPSNPLMEACRGEKSCFMALDGAERGLCEAYKEGKSCFMALEGVDQGWCEVLKEGRSCFMALDGEARENCETGRFPGRHLFWDYCAKDHGAR